MKNCSSVAILLAAYNSETYLPQQIESILNQTFNDWTLYINDDGSDDNTFNIINSFTSKYKGKIFHLDLRPKNLGAAFNFQALLHEVDSTYYMFCDHDDFWLPAKIEVTLNRMIELEEEYPNVGIVVHSDLTVVDENLRVIYPSFYKYSKTDPHKFCSFNYLGVANCITGCTMILNNAVRRIVPPLQGPNIMHDWWIALHVSKKGIISYLPIRTILYRQHSKNVIGAKRIGFKYLIGIIADLKKTIHIDVYNYKLLKTIGYGTWPKYIFFKLLFQIRRFL